MTTSPNPLPELFAAAVQVAVGPDRAAFVERVGGPDVPLRRDLDRLLAAHDRAVAAERKTLRDSEDFLNATGRMANVGGWELDVAAGTVRWTDQTYRIHDLPVGLQPSLAEAVAFYHPDDRGRIVEAVRRAVELGEPYDDEYRLITAAGRSIRARTICVPQLERGRVVRLVGTFQDVTERRLAEEELRRANERFALAVEAAGIGVWDYDLTADVLTWDDRMFALFGIAPEGFPGNGAAWLAALHPDDSARAVAEFKAAMTGERAFDVEFRVVTPVGEVRHLRGNAHIARDADGRAVRATGVNYDVTARKRAEAERREMEEQLRLSQKMDAIGRFAGGVAHDFNNLLTVVNGYAQVLLDALDPDDPNREAAVAVLHAGERGAALTQQLLAFGRKQIVKVEVVDLNAVVAGMRPLLSRLLGETVRIAVGRTAGRAAVRADAGQLEQVLMNLAVNARDAMPRGGRLTVATDAVVLDGPTADFPEAAPGRYVRLAVADTGCGMTDDVKARAFEPFFTTKDVGQGTGLGLATVYGILRGCGGHVAIDTAAGAGSTFRILFPAAEEPPPPDAPSGPRALHGVRRGSEFVLLVEDDVAVRDLTRSLLEGLGYRVAAVADGAEAIALCERPEVAVGLLVTDVMMPGLSGPEVAELARARRPGLKVLFISGYTDDAVFREGVRRDEVAFLHKPFTVDALARAVRDLLDGPAECAVGFA